MCVSHWDGCEGGDVAAARIRYRYKSVSKIGRLSQSVPEITWPWGVCS
jgi:hypothetical protein